MKKYLLSALTLLATIPAMLPAAQAAGADTYVSGTCVSFPAGGKPFALKRAGAVHTDSTINNIARNVDSDRTTGSVSIMPKGAVINPVYGGCIDYGETSARHAAELMRKHGCIANVGCKGGVYVWKGNTLLYKYAVPKK